MNFICNQKTLSQAISNAQRAINNKTTIELLRGILISTEGSSIKIIGYDSEISIETRIEADVVSEGSIVVNSRIFGDIIRKFPDTYVSIETDDELNIFITCQSSRFKLKGMSSESFPKQSDVNSDKKLKIKQSTLRDMIKQTAFATATEPINPTLVGGLFEVVENKINMAALDGYRLAVRSETLEEGLGFNINAIIPGTTLSHLNTLLSEDGDVVVGFDEKNVLFELGHTTIVARLIEGKFTEYSRLIPKEYLARVTVDTKKLLNAIERASILFTSDKNNLIKLSISNNILVITSNNEIGNAYEEVDIELDGDSLEIGFNSRYFIEGIKNISSETINIEFGGSVNPCIIRPSDELDYTYLLLPVRLNG